MLYEGMLLLRVAIQVGEGGGVKVLQDSGSALLASFRVLHSLLMRSQVLGDTLCCGSHVRVSFGSFESGF